MEDSRYINFYNGGVGIDLREILKQMIVVDDFVLHSGKKSLLKFDIDRIPKSVCEDIFTYGMNRHDNTVPAIIMNSGFRFIKKGYKHVQIYTDLISNNNLINNALYLPVGLREINVSIVDDIVTTGKAMDDAEKILGDNGFIVKNKICLLNRGNYKCDSLIDKEQMMEWLGL